jgi:dUTP pyrophosphatase
MAKKPGKPVKVRVVRLPHARGLPLPSYQSREAAGLDLSAAVPEAEPLRLPRGARVLVPTGLVLELPKGYEAQVRPRSGLALRHGVTVLNSPGTIDSDYRGEVMVLLVNLGPAPFLVARGERIAQLVVQPVARANLVEIRPSRSRRTVRGAGGFGSTGIAVGTAAARISPPAVRRRPKRKPAVARTRAIAKRTGNGRIRPRR